MTIGESAWRAPDGIETDVLECRAAWCGEALAAARSNRDAQGQPILPLAHLVRMKLQAGRARDIGDLAQMLGQAEPAVLDNVRALVRQYAPADLADLERLIRLGRLELEPPG